MLGHKIFNIFNNLFNEIFSFANMIAFKAVENIKSNYTSLTSHNNLNVGFMTASKFTFRRLYFFFSQLLGYSIVFWFSLEVYLRWIQTRVVVFHQRGITGRLCCTLETTRQRQIDRQSASNVGRLGDYCNICTVEDIIVVEFFNSHILSIAHTIQLLYFQVK